MSFSYHVFKFLTRQNQIRIVKMEDNPMVFVSLIFKIYFQSLKVLAAKYHVIDLGLPQQTMGSLFI